MKRFAKVFFSLLCAALIALPVLSACGPKDDNPGGNGGGGEDTPVHVDYVKDLQLDFTSDTKKQEVTVKIYIDGDTTHFNPVEDSTLTGYNAADFADTQGYIKARYLAINTPESTGKIEKWGKTASLFTKGKLSGAKSIIVESDTDKWNIDSTGERYTLWVWYLPEEETDPTAYRNLNVEILQEGLAIASSTANNRYGTVATAALEQAKREQLCVFSPDDTVDENYYEGDAFVIDLKELRCHVDTYLGKWVRVEGVVTAKFNNTVYIEELDGETGLYFGMQVYYGYQNGAIVEVLSVGNRVSVYGSFTDFNGTYQISGVDANEFRPKSETNTWVEGEEGAYEASFVETSASDIVSRTEYVPFYTEDEEGERTLSETVELPYAEAVMGTSVSISNLTVSRISTTQSGGNAGAMTIYCRDQNNVEVTIRTVVLKENGEVVTDSRFLNQKISIKGIVSKWTDDEGNLIAYQIIVHRLDYITIL